MDFLGCVEVSSIPDRRIVNVDIGGGLQLFDLNDKLRECK